MTENKKETITRREFLKLGAVALGSLAFNRLPDLAPPTVGGEPNKDKPDLSPLPEIKDVFLKSRSITAQKAAEFAQSQFADKPYRLGLSDCAIFTARYAFYYGLSLDHNNQSPSVYKPAVEKGLPDATTVKQVTWFKEAAKILGKPELVTDIPTKSLADENFWRRVNPGSLVYLRTAGESQHGYDQYSHTGAFVGIVEGKPLFAEYSLKMTKRASNQKRVKTIFGNVFRPVA